MCVCPREYWCCLFIPHYVFSGTRSGINTYAHIHLHSPSSTCTRLSVYLIHWQSSSFRSKNAFDSFEENHSGLPGCSGCLPIPFPHSSPVRVFAVHYSCSSFSLFLSILVGVHSPSFFRRHFDTGGRMGQQGARRGIYLQWLLGGVGRHRAGVGQWIRVAGEPEEAIPDSIYFMLHRPPVSISLDEKPSFLYRVHHVTLNTIQKFDSDNRHYVSGFPRIPGCRGAK